MALTTIFLLWGGGALTLAVAIWRSSLVSKWLAVPFGLAYYMCVSSDPLVTLIGGFVMLVVGGWIAPQIGCESAARSPGRAPIATPPAA
jgi:hypothetical protein